MNNNFLFWVIFSIVILCILTIDLYVTDHRKGKITIKTSLIWSAVWITTALCFNLFIFFQPGIGKEKAIEFFTGFILEKSLSVDNLFVFFMIFSMMGTKNENQPHVLKWGIIGAIVSRVFFILFGVMLLNYFHFVIYIFGIILLAGAWKMAFGDDAPIDLENNRIIKFMRKRFNILTDYNGKKFFKRKEGKLYITYLLITLIVIDAADLVFALDSIPAVMAITKDPFIIITSNIFAIIGLRALYFALAGFAELFAYLKYGIAIILLYVGFKMLSSNYINISGLVSLIIISTCLVVSVLLSVYLNTRLVKREAAKK
jgi:tellurite resistance protein TerC